MSAACSAIHVYGHRVEHFTWPYDANGRPDWEVSRMPMIDVHADAGIFCDKHQLAQDLARAGHANTQADIAAQARAGLSAGDARHA